MEEKYRHPVLERLQELEGWAEYIVEALHLNQRAEPVTKEMLKEALGDRELREIRELSWSLREKLHRVATQLELSHSAEKVTV